MKTILKAMKTRARRGVLLGLAALTLALTAAPAAAAPEWQEPFRGWHREARYHRGWEHERWRHRHYRHFGYFAPVPYYYATPYCYRQHGYSAWNGWRSVWVPPLTVCR